MTTHPIIKNLPIENEFANLLEPNNENRDGILLLDTNDYFFVFCSTTMKNHESVDSKEHRARLVLYLKNKGDVDKQRSNYLDDAIQYLEEILFKRKLLLKNHNNLHEEEGFKCEFRDFVKSSWHQVYSNNDKTEYKLRLSIMFTYYKNFVKQQLLSIKNIDNEPLLEKRYLINKWGIGKKNLEILEEAVKNGEDNYRIAINFNNLLPEGIPPEVIDLLREEMI